MSRNFHEGRQRVLSPTFSVEMSQHLGFKDIYVRMWC